jgi:hypothetical protein
MALHEWAFATRTFRQMHGKEGGSTGLDNDFAVRGFSNIGAWILGRNMFVSSATLRAVCSGAQRQSLIRFRA